MSSFAQLENARTETPSKASAASFEFLDLKKQFATIKDEVMESVTRVMESQKFILGEDVRLLEEQLAEFLGARHAVTCASGSDALFLALMAAGIKPGDEVITSPFTFVATAGSIARVGAKAVFVDIDPQTLNIDVHQIEAAITPATRAILPVHLFGLPADLTPILSLAEPRGLAVIEDAAQAIAAQYGGRTVGTIGTLGCFSFFPSKNLGCAGDGGLVTTEDPELADRLRLLRVHGSHKKYYHEILGMNSRLDALQAAILQVKLRHLDEWTRTRQAIANRYIALFEDSGLTAFVRLLRVAPSNCRHVYNQFTIRCRQRDELRASLTAAGIPTEIYYPVPLHLQPAFAYLGCDRGRYPEAERACGEVLSVPIYPELTATRQESVVRAILNFYSTKK